MARRQDPRLPARLACAGLALLVGVWAGIAAAGDDSGMPPFRLELGPVMQPAGESPVLLTTVPEPDPPAAR